MIKLVTAIALAGISSAAFATDCPNIPANGVTWNKKEFDCIMAQKREEWNRPAQTGTVGTAINNPDVYGLYLDVRNAANAIQREDEPYNYFFNSPPK